MRGIYKNGKIEYRTPVVYALTRGNWKTGFSGNKKIGGDVKYYEVVSDVELIEGERYKFEVVDGKAYILTKK
jgi:hypothetical protein